jgi:enoyl-CoA hydratase/carnithine racemase
MSEVGNPGRVSWGRDGRLFVIEIDRPAKYNAFSPEMLNELSAAYQAYQDDDEAWCALVSAKGKHFTAGLELDRYDIRQPLIVDGQMDPLGLREPRCSKPLVFAVKGICFTIGIELMLGADVVLAADTTRFGQLEVQRGLMAFGGATIRMVARAGWGNAMRWLLTGDEFAAEEAYRMGLVQEICPEAEVDARARAVALKICAAAPLAVQASKHSARLAVEGGADAAVAAFGAQLSELADSEDFAEGVASFKERRQGQYRGR